MGYGSVWQEDFIRKKKKIVNQFPYCKNICDKTLTSFILPNVKLKDPSEITLKNLFILKNFTKQFNKELKTKN